MQKGETMFCFYVNSRFFYGSHEQDIRFQRFTSPVKENTRRQKAIPWDAWGWERMNCEVELINCHD